MKNLCCSFLFVVLVLPGLSSETLDETSLLRFDQILSNLQDGELIPLRAESVRYTILTKSRVLSDEGVESVSPAERRKIVRELLGPDRYDQAVLIFTEGLASPDPVYRITSANFLGEAMGALEAAPALRKQLQFEGAAMFESLETPEDFELNIGSILAKTVALAYLRDTEMLDTGLLGTLLDSGPPPDSAARLIRAMAYADSPGWKERVLPYLESGEIAEAQAAFEVFDRSEYYEAYSQSLLDGSAKWIPEIRNILEERGTLDIPSRSLFSRMTAIGGFIFRDVEDNEFGSGKVREDLMFIAENGQTNVRYSALLWLRYFENGDILPWLFEFLEDENPLVREGALSAIALSVDPQIIRDHARDIFPLLEDSNRMVQGFAVYALQSGLEVPAANLYSDRELAEAKIKVLEAYSEIGIEPDGK